MATYTKSQETANVSNLRQLSAKVRKALSSDDEKVKNSFLKSYDELIPKSDQTQQEYITKFLEHLGSQNINVRHLVTGNGLQQLLLEQTNNYEIQGSVPYESMDDETLVELSRGETAFMVQGLESGFKIRRLNGVTYRVFILSYKDLHDLQQIDKEKRKDVDKNIIKYMHRGIAKTHQVGELRQEPIDDALPSQSPLEDINDAQEGLQAGSLISTPVRSHNRGRKCYRLQVDTSPNSVCRTIDLDELGPSTTACTKDIEECEMKYVRKIINAIKGATNISSLHWPSHTSQNDRAASYSDKGLCKQYELKQHGRLAKLLHEQSTACSVVEAHCLAEEYLSKQTQAVQYIVDNYILELYYFKELVEDLIEFSNLTIDKSSVYSVDEKHRLEKFYGISIAAISLFSKISGQLGLLTDYEQRDSIVERFRNLRINVDYKLNSTTLFEASQRLSYLADLLFKRVKINNTLTVTETRGITRTMTSTLVRGRCDSELLKLKSDLLEAAETLNSTSVPDSTNSMTKYGPISMIIHTLGRLGQEILESERMDLHHNYEKGDSGSVGREKLKPTVSFFANTDDSSFVVNNVQQDQKPICPYEFSYFKGIRYKACRYGEKCDRSHDRKRFNNLTSAEKDKLTCKVCGVEGCLAAVYKNFTCKQNPSPKGKGPKKDANKPSKNKNTNFQRKYTQAINALSSMPVVRKAIMEKNSISDEQDTSEKDDADDSTPTEQTPMTVDNAISNFPKGLLEAVQSRVLNKKGKKRNTQAGRKGSGKRSKKNRGGQ